MQVPTGLMAGSPDNELGTEEGNVLYMHNAGYVLLDFLLVFLP